ncbi:MAG: hypothetical protein AAFP20_14880 [Cyanobacteria bacterium J06614_10]
MSLSVGAVMRYRVMHVLVDKLGEESANRVFERGELIEGHPHGDFAVAYLMRKFDK